jgi:C-lobe and N-lobe beta barrels of Tf-binding protein B
MRQVSFFALVASSLSLAACAGGGGAGGTLSAFDIVQDLPISCSGVVGTCPAGSGDGDGTTTDPDPDPVTPDPGTGTGGSPGANNGNGGNTTNINTGDPVLALEAGKVVSSKSTPSLGALTLTTAPNTAKFVVDTNTANNNLWAIPKTMDEYVTGTNASGGVGLGGTYKEYRAYQDSNTDGYDELLQVWTFGHSYALQYRDETSGSDVADKQAWAFGGITSTSVTPGAALPVAGIVTYNGRFGSTAITSSWKNSEDANQAVNYNNSWRVIGAASLDVNFANNSVTGRLDPETWRTEEDYNNKDGGPRDVLSTASSNILDLNYDPNFAGFMTSDILLNGTLVKTATGNTIAGGATMDTADGWLSDGTNNPFYGAIYGPAGDEVTGNFAASGSNPAPIGGTFPLNNPTRGKISHSGVFNTN